MSLSPAAQFINDMRKAFGQGQANGVSIKKLAELARDFADDLRDLADDNQWPTRPRDTDEGSDADDR